MKERRKEIFQGGVFFGIITLITGLFMLPWHIALLLASFVVVIFICVVSTVINENAKKHAADYEIIGRKVLHKETSKYFSGKFSCNGILYSTNDSLIFISHKNKQMLKEEMPIASIKDAWHGMLLGGIPGLKIIMNDDSEKGFTVVSVRKYVERVLKER